jgi:hypothetical protein
MAGAASVGAIPEAAEREDAPVVIGANAAKAKVSVRPAKKAVRERTLPTARAKLRKPAVAARKVSTAASGK